MTRRRKRIHQSQRSATERELHAVARPDQPAAREPMGREQELASWWAEWGRP
jgi:hypothetical protein